MSAPGNGAAQAVETLQISTPSGSLEVLACKPSSPTKQQSILCVHGAHCSAACFKLLLPLFARAGYASYAVSVRGHGGSWQPSTFAFHALTNLNSFVSDIIAALELVLEQHPQTQPILVGHSMGGAILQRALGAWNRLGSGNTHPAGLVLLGAAPLSGGAMDIGKRWQAAEPAQAPGSSPHPPPQVSPARSRSFFTFQPKTGLETPAQVRSRFFSAEAPDDVVAGWLIDNSSIRLESIRVSIEHMWPFAEAADVLAAIRSDARPLGRKILAISGGKDVLVSPDLTRETFEAYRTAAEGEEEVMRACLAHSGHQIMLDVEHERCAELIISWVEGKEFTIR